MKNILVEEKQRLRKTLLHGHKRLTFSKLINWPQKNNVLKTKGSIRGSGERSIENTQLFQITLQHI